MNRTKAVQTALELIKVRIESGTMNAGSEQIINELNTLVDGLEKLNDETRQHSPSPAQGAQHWMG